ncbi:hypothetical protein L7F22_004542 [Adiantum nelumboides]|nr:hypothetical protein [Adiantum nelumboides]
MKTFVPYISKLKFELQGFKDEDSFCIADGDGEDVILGMPWNHKVDLAIYSRKKKVEFTHTGKKYEIQAGVSGDTIPMGKLGSITVQNPAQNKLPYCPCTVPCTLGLVPLDSAREKAMLVNLEFIKAIVTAQEIMVLDPTSAAVLPFIEQLKETLLASKAEASAKSLTNRKEADAHETFLGSDFVGSTQDELPFEFRVLEVALEIVCGFLETQVKELECSAIPVLDELTRNVSTSNLELVRSLKSDLTRLLSRVQKVRDEMEHLLDDDEDMADLFLTRKLNLSQQDDFHSFNTPPSSPRVSHLSSRRCSTASYAGTAEDHNVEQLEMLLEAYFVQVDGTHKKILAVREYIDDTEDYVNIQLDSQRNELIQLHVTLGILALTASLVSACAGALAINIPCPLYNKEGVFVPIVTSFVSVSVALFFIILGYARWKGHFTS